MVFNPWKNDNKHELYKIVDAIGKSLYDMPFKPEDDWRMCMAKMWVEHIKLTRRFNAWLAYEAGECHCESCFETNVHADQCDWENEGYRCHHDPCYESYLAAEEIDGTYFKTCLYKGQK